MCGTADGSYQKQLSFYYIAHFSGYIAPGAVRVGVSRFADSLDVTAFQNPDGKLIAVLVNRTRREAEVYLRLRGQTIPLCLPENAIGTAVIDA
jgi:glucosylceramidase